MLNYKKPRFWIVIAAIVLCIVVAVCFLAGPRDYGPEVGNPQMLELPGVAWFATPEEVKEALNLTKAQILGESKSSGFVLRMAVTDLTLYGRDVPYAVFEFWFNNNGNTALKKATVFFSEDTDMSKLEKELIEIYGPGIAEPYRYDVPLDGTDLELSNLEATAKGEDGWDAIEGNPYRDALEDPNYMAHHWVLENGSSVIPEEVVEYLKSSEEEDMPQDEEAFMEKLDQMPWVVISMENRHAGAIYYDITKKDELNHRLYTNNYIEFNAKLLADYLYTAQTTNPS